MNKKGFTLVEVLGVIIILAVIFVLVFPSVTNILSQSEETIYQKQINTILNSTYDFTLKNPDYLPNNNQNSYVTLGQLKYDGLIDTNIKNPKTNKKFPDNLVISINNVGSNYKNLKNTSKLEGNYLYTVELDKLNNFNSNDIPEMTLKVDGNEVKINSDRNYIEILNLNDELKKITLSAISKSGKDLTDRITKNIIMNDRSVRTIDTSKQGIYKINYSVVDDDGNANILIYNIIIGDITPPIIIIPEETKINKDTIKFDLSKDIYCEDNSGFCDITFVDTIDYGVVGKYIVEYTSKDPSGNLSTKKRVVEIE